jgi:hypothetical protein
MKNTLVRSFVLVLVVAGFSASSIASAAATKHVAKTAPLGIFGTPTPFCPLNQKDGCGIM